MITYPLEDNPFVTITAPQWLRNEFQREYGKTMEERYREKLDEVMVGIFKKIKSEENLVEIEKINKRSETAADN